MAFLGCPLSVPCKKWWSYPSVIGMKTSLRASSKQNLVVASYLDARCELIRPAGRVLQTDEEAETKEELMSEGGEG